MKKTDRIIITGGGGFIGGHLVDKTVDKYNVFVLDNYCGSVKHKNLKAKYFYENIMPEEEGAVKSVDIRKFETPIENIDCVIHLAAIPRVIKSIENPVETDSTNVNGLVNMLSWSVKNKVKKFIFISSSSVYGDQETMPLKETMLPKPKSPYGLQKRTGEEYCRLFYELFGLNSIIIRPFNVYGQRMDMESDYAGVIGRFIKQKAKGETLTICGSGEQTRDFTYVDDVVGCIIKAIESDIKGVEIFNCGGGNNVSVNEIANIIGGEKKYIEARPNEPKDTLADISKAEKLLGWKPKTKLKDGIANIV